MMSERITITMSGSELFHYFHKEKEGEKQSFES